MDRSAREALGGDERRDSTYSPEIKGCFVQRSFSVYVASKNACFLSFTSALSSSKPFVVQFVMLHWPFIAFHSSQFFISDRVVF